MDRDRRLRLKVVERLARRKIVGAHKKQVDTVKNWFATDEQGRVEDLIREMIRVPNAPLEGYGGSRDNVRLTSIEERNGTSWTGVANCRGDFETSKRASEPRRSDQRDDRLFQKAPSSDG